MHRTFGSVQPFEEGLLAPIMFPELARMDEWTPDGRMLASMGGNCRELPRTIYVQFEQAPGHMASIAVGRIDQVEMHDDGNVSGQGWLVDIPAARLAYTMVKTKALRHNSVDLADTKHDYQWGPDDELRVLFVEWSVGASTIVGKPAFKNARSEVGEITAAMIPDDFEVELTASGAPVALVVAPESWSIRMPSEQKVEQTASAAAAATVPAAAFYQPENTSKPGGQKLRVDANGWISGHLGVYGEAHASFPGETVRISRSMCNYAKLLGAGPLVEFDDGSTATIETAPLFLFGGHVTGMAGKTQAEIEEAYGGVENAWGDYRITDGKLGPWISGMVRPGATEEQIYAARCSRVSGHWLNGELRATVSVNVPGYNVEGSGEPDARFSERLDDDNNLELVASFAPPVFDVESEPKFTPPATTAPAAERPVVLSTSDADDDIAEVMEMTGVVEAQFSDGVVTVPTDKMASTARIALHWTTDGGPQLSAVQRARANDIAAQKPLSIDRLRRMAGWFARHEPTGDLPDGWEPGTPGFPSQDRVAWSALGGSFGQEFVTRKLAAIDSGVADLADVVSAQSAIIDDEL